MAETKKPFAFDINDRVVIKETGREGWVSGLMINRDNGRLYSIDTTNADGRPEHLWARDGDIVSEASATT